MSHPTRAPRSCNFRLQHTIPHLAGSVLGAWGGPSDASFRLRKWGKSDLSRETPSQHTDKMKTGFIASNKLKGHLSKAKFLSRSDHGLPRARDSWLNRQYDTTKTANITGPLLQKPQIHSWVCLLIKSRLPSKLTVYTCSIYLLSSTLYFIHELLQIFSF